MKIQVKEVWVLKSLSFKETAEKAIVRYVKLQGKNSLLVVQFYISLKDQKY